MKKFLVVCAALALASAGFCAEPQSAPEANFDGATASTTVIDVLPISKKFDDRVRVIQGADGFMIYKIHVWREKKNQWQYFGPAKLEHFSDTDFVDSNGEIGKCRWVAITPLDGGDFVYSTAASHKDLYIYVFPKNQTVDAATKAKAAVFDSSKTSGKFKDNVVLVNKTRDLFEEFTVYAFNDEQSDEWAKIGYVQFVTTSAETTTTSSSKRVDTPYDQVSSFRYFAVVPKSGKAYAYETKKENNDFIITAIEK